MDLENNIVDNNEIKALEQSISDLTKKYNDEIQALINPMRERLNLLKDINNERESKDAIHTYWYDIYDRRYFYVVDVTSSVRCGYRHILFDCIGYETSGHRFFIESLSSDRILKVSSVRKITESEFYTGISRSVTETSKSSEFCNMLARVFNLKEIESD